MNLNLDYLPNQVLLAPVIQGNKPGFTEVILVRYLNAPVKEKLDNGESILLDCVIHYPSLRQSANACSAMLKPAPPTL